MSILLSLLTDDLLEYVFKDWVCDMKILMHLENALANHSLRSKFLSIRKWIPSVFIESNTNLKFYIEWKRGRTF